MGHIHISLYDLFAWILYSHNFYAIKLSHMFIKQSNVESEKKRNMHIQSQRHYNESEKHHCVWHSNSSINFLKSRTATLCGNAMHFTSKHCMQNVIVNKSSITMFSKLKLISLVFSRFCTNKLIRCMSLHWAEPFFSFDNLDRFSFRYLHFL